MEQLSLEIPKRLVYSAENFLLHSGVKDVAQECLTLLSAGKVTTSFLFGEGRSGKTHLSVFLTQKLFEQDSPVVVYHGSELSEMLDPAHELPDLNSSAIIVDDAHEYFLDLVPGKSGPFVRFMEHVRNSKRSILFLSRHRLEIFEFDDHVRSRLKLGTGLSIGQADDTELPEIIQLMALQRGIRISQRKVAYLEKRLPRSILEIEQYFAQNF